MCAPVQHVRRMVLLSFALPESPDEAVIGRAGQPGSNAGGGWCGWAGGGGGGGGGGGSSSYA